MKKEQRKAFENIKKMGVSQNVNGFDFEKIKMLEVLKKALTDPSDIQEVDAEIAKLRASPEFKEYEVEKKLEKIKEDF
jgi:hypothetical protein